MNRLRPRLETRGAGDDPALSIGLLLKKKINFVEKDAKNNEKFCVSARVSANDMKGRKTKEQR